MGTGVKVTVEANAAAAVALVDALLLGAAESEEPALRECVDDAGAAAEVAVLAGVRSCGLAICARPAPLLLVLLSLPSSRSSSSMVSASSRRVVRSVATDARRDALCEAPALAASP